MKRIQKIQFAGWFWTIWGILAFTACQPSHTLIRLQLENGQPAEEITLMTKDSIYVQPLNAEHAVEFVLPGEFEPAYGAFFLRESHILLYIEPGKDFDVSAAFVDNKLVPAFSGEGAGKNQYLNDEALRYTPDFKADEATFLAALEKQLDSLYRYLDRQGFDSGFLQLEKKRLKYTLYKDLPGYPGNHIFATWSGDYKPTQAFYDALDNAFSEDESLLDMAVYQEFLNGYLAVKQTNYVDDIGQLEYTKNQLDYITHNFKNPQVISYLVHDMVYNYVEQFGIADLTELSPVYEAKVVDEKQRKEFEKLCAKWFRIEKGQPSPSFAFEDINGKIVQLSDLAGKYVYIDYWATWCGPCRKEQPFLAELEKKYADRNICFVSISCDEDKAAWAKLVKKEKLGGIQLYEGVSPKDDHTFSFTYMVSAIPRFILLDKEGKIINANMSRPSDAATVELFDSLEGL